MAEIEFKKFPLLVVRRGSPAEGFFHRTIGMDGLKPGLIYSVTDEEFESLQDDVIAFEESIEEKKNVQSSEVSEG